MAACHRSTAFLALAAVFVFLLPVATQGWTPFDMKKLEKINKMGPFFGIVVPNGYEIVALINNGAFTEGTTIDIGGRRFHVGTVSGKPVVVVMTGLATINAAISTTQLLDYFNIKGVLLYGIAGGLSDTLDIGDVTIAQAWAHTGLWNWQKYGDGPNDMLNLEAFGDFTRKYGRLDMKLYSKSGKKIGGDSLLNNVYYQPEEVFPVTGTPEVRSHKFWFHVDPYYLSIAKTLNVSLQQCTDPAKPTPESCLAKPPKLVVGTFGVAASTFLDNKAYRGVLHKKFKAASVDMETHAVAMVCYTYKVPFIGIRALSDLAGGGEGANQIGTFFSFASLNAAKVIEAFLSKV